MRSYSMSYCRQDVRAHHHCWLSDSFRGVYAAGWLDFPIVLKKGHVERSWHILYRRDLHEDISFISVFDFFLTNYVNSPTLSITHHIQIPYICLAPLIRAHQFLLSEAIVRSLHNQDLA